MPSPQLTRWQNALPFWLSLLLIPVAVFAAAKGGWALDRKSTRLNSSHQ